MRKETVETQLIANRGVRPAGLAHGEGEDGFQFVLSQEEFLDIFFDDLELPDLLRKQMKSSENFTPVRAGHAISGPIAQHEPHADHEKQPGTPHCPETAASRADSPSSKRKSPGLRSLTIRTASKNARSFPNSSKIHRQRSQRIPFIDPIDVRYNRFELVPQPVTSAVMFCLMDVSGSMTEHMKDLAKRFYKLLYLFLRRRYRDVDLVFIRHTHMAREVDEETFFFSTETGGTVVSTAFEEMLRVVDQNVNPSTTGTSMPPRPRMATTFRVTMPRSSAFSGTRCSQPASISPISKSAIRMA